MATANALSVLLVLLLVGCCSGRPVPSPPASASSAPRTVDGITAIYNFGDSISDTGNLLREGAAGVMQHTTGLPYGAAVDEGATGRCSDGYLTTDFLAKDLGVRLLRPYLDKGADFTHGVNFAVTGATALDTAALARIGIHVPHTNSSLKVQLQLFKDYMNTTAKSHFEVREKLANSLVMVGEIGGNDYNYAFAMNRPRADGGHSLYNIGRMMTGAVESIVLVPEVVQSVVNAAKELLDMGATRMVVPGKLPLGCVPSYLAAGEREGIGGVLRQWPPHRPQSLRADAQRAAVQGIRELRRSYPAAAIAYADYFSAHVRMLEAAPKMGFDGAALTTACCGAYNFDMDRMCASAGTAST